MLQIGVLMINITLKSIVIIASLIICLLLANVWLVYRDIEKMYINARWVIHTHQVIETLNNMFLFIKNLEASELQYLNTKNYHYLGQYFSQTSKLFEESSSLDKLIKDNPYQALNASQLKHSIHNHLILMSNGFYLGRQNSLPLINVMLDHEKNGMENITGQVLNMTAIENGLLERRKTIFHTVRIRLLVGNLLVNAILLITVAAFVYFLRLYLINKEKTASDCMRLASILAASKYAIICKDCNGIITSWSKGAEKIFGYSPQEVINKPITLLFPPDRLAEGSEILQRINRGEQVENHMTIRRHKDGHLINVSLCICPIQNTNNGVVGASKIAQDITEQYALETQLRDRNSELEQISYMASHDLKQPLIMIKSFADFLITRMSVKLEKKELEYLETIKLAADQGISLIKDLLDYSNIGKKDSLQPVDLNAVINSVGKSLALLIQDSGACIECTPNIPTVNCIPSEMRQLFQNLIENAIKYRGSVPLKIQISAKESENDRWLLSVKDNGEGISAKNIKRIFKIFERADTNVEGAGIGLSICKKIVESLGGKIWVESIYGKGSTFYFTLPGMKQTSL